MNFLQNLVPNPRKDFGLQGSKDNNNKRMSPVIAGSIAGAAGYLGTLPLDFIKQRLQTTSVDLKATNRLILQSVKDNGIKVLFKGGIIGSMSIVPQMAIKFSVNDYLTHQNKNQKSKLTPFKNGFIAGYIDGSFLGPVLAIQSILQMEAKKTYGYKDAVQVIKRVPVFSFTFPLAFRNAAYTTVLLGGQKSLENKYQQTVTNNFLISSALNIPGVIACSPFDVIRAKQIQYILANKTSNPFIITRDIYSANGLRGFYQGFGSLYINFALRFPATFSIYFLLMH